jgi:glycosyltransferase involved in cell wall biosynthesis
VHATKERLSMAAKARLAIGILAHNEAETLPVMLESLFEQSIFREHLDAVQSVDVVCVPNGCRDDTAGVAQRTLERLNAAIGRNLVTFRVVSLAEPGKANAWNHCVHELTRDADYVCMLDADIVFGERETIARAVEVLDADARVCVATDLPLKRPSREHDGTPLAALSNLFTRASPPGPSDICGQFYCARGSVLRRIWLPPGLPVEDGMLRALIITDEFRSPEDDRRIVRAPGATHYFEPYVNVAQVWHHKKRLMIGSTLNILLFQYLWENSKPDGAGPLLRKKLEQDPAWLARYLQTAIDAQRWVVPMGHVLGRFRDLRQAPLRKRLMRSPVVLVATAIDLAVAVSANRDIKRGTGLGFW